MFSGTIRSNLDPFGLYEDARLWDALRRAYLVDNTDGPGAAKISQDYNKTDYEAKISMDGGDEGAGPAAATLASGATTPMNRYTLDTVIESEGSNLSVGERSLLSLARALVKDSKVVVLDEAT